MCGARGSEWKGVEEVGGNDWGDREGLAGRVHGEADQAEEEMAEGPEVDGVVAGVKFLRRRRRLGLQFSWE